GELCGCLLQCRASGCRGAARARCSVSRSRGKGAAGRMTLTRRDLLIAVGSTLLAVNIPVLAAGQSQILIEMRGTARGERVWFDPFGVAVKPGETLRFINRDKGNSHTVTAYHPELFERVRRIPSAAKPFNSG